MKKKSNVIEQDATTTVLLDGWFFKGFWAFYLFGPYPKDNDESTLLEIEDLNEFYTKNKSLLGRKHARSTQSGISSFESSSQRQEHKTQLSSPFKRGISLSDKLTAATIASITESQKIRKHDQQIFSLRSSIDSLQQSLQFEYEIGKSMNDLTRFKDLLKKLDAAREELETIRKRNLEYEGENEFVTSVLLSMQQQSSSTLSGAAVTPKDLTIHTDGIEKRASFSSSISNISAFHSVEKNRECDSPTMMDENQLRKCAAAHSGKCGAGTYIKGEIQHYCFNCKLPLHGGVCGELISELTMETKKKFTRCNFEDAPGLSMVCNSCLLVQNMK
jgi:hypothetical protein